MSTTVYLVYADRDPQRDVIRQAIKGTPIIPLPCRNINCKNLLCDNSSQLRIESLPVFVCRQGNYRWQLSWSQLDIAKKIAQ